MSQLPTVHGRLLVCSLELFERRCLEQIRLESYEAEPSTQLIETLNDAVRLVREYEDFRVKWLDAPPSPAALGEAQQQWRCFHCDEILTDRIEALRHFGADEGACAACRVDAAELARIREVEADNEKLRRENERLENDSRLWHESEADRVRRIGYCQWWQELDSREGERLVLTEQLAERDARIATLQAQLDHWTEQESIEQQAMRLNRLDPPR